MKRYLSLTLAISSALLLVTFFTFSCKNTGERSDKSNSVDEGRSTAALTLSDPNEDEIMKRGEIVYKKECLACHQADGSGVPMMFPPITESEIINGDNQKLILLILNGLKGPIEIKGEQYNSIMPPMKDHLNDQEIADLLSYIRNSFGNSADKITRDEVARARE